MDGLACLTTLESLEFRGCQDTLTDEVGVRGDESLGYPVVSWGWGWG
jgi:hypothetical protein